MINFNDIMNTTYFGNTIYNYGVSFAILIGFILLGRIFAFIVKNFIKNIADKTKTKADDIIIESLEKPMFLFFFVIGLFAISIFLVLPDKAGSIFEKLNTSLLIFAFSWFFINLADKSIASYLEPLAKKSQSELDDHLIPLLRKLVKTALVLIAIIMILSDLGFDVASIIAGLGIGGLAFALAAKDLLANLFGGVAIIMDKSFQLNQRIKVQGVDGTVKQIGLRTTVIETFDGTKMTIPNSKIADSVIENVSYEQARKVKLTLGVACSTTNKQMEKAILELKKAIDGHKNVKEKTIVRFDNFGSYALDLGIIYWISALGEIGQTKHEINMLIKKTMEDLKIEMPYPTQTLEIKK